MRLSLANSYTAFALCALLAIVNGPRAEAVEYIAFGDVGHSVSNAADWTSSGGIGFDEHYQTSANNFATSTWEFTGLANDTYYVSANWAPFSNRSTMAQYNISDGLGPVVIDQQDATRDFVEIVPGVGGIGWKNLGQVLVGDGNLSITLSDIGDFANSNLFIMADAIRISTTPGVTALPGVGLGQVIDNGDPSGFAIAGEGPNAGANGGVAEWIPSAGGFNNSLLFDNEDGYTSHSGALSATWSFDNLMPGAVYEVSSTWVQHSNRGSNVPYTIAGALGGDQTVLVNQKVVPDSPIFEYDAGGVARQFKRLGYFSVVGDELIVSLANNANGFAIPDAVRIQLVPEPGVIGLAWIAALAMSVALRRKRMKIARGCATE